MKKIILITILFALVMAPASLLAMDHGSKKSMDHDGMDHKSMDHGSMDHKSMGSHGDMMMLGSEVVEGVKAEARIKDTSEAMAKMGMDHTHHLMVSFVKEGHDAKKVAIENGTVAIKVKNPDGSETKPLKMMGMAGAFGADLVLKEKGMYHFYVGTKLEDGVKRQYQFHTEVK